MLAGAFDYSPLNRGTMSEGIYPSGAIMMACVESLHRRGDLAGEGCCFDAKGSSPLFEDDVNYGGELPVLLVLAVDMQARHARPQLHRWRMPTTIATWQDRLNPKGASRLWKELIEAHPIGFCRAESLVIIDVASAPNLGRPLASFGSARENVRPRTTD